MTTDALSAEPIKVWLVFEHPNDQWPFAFRSEKAALKEAKTCARRGEAFVTGPYLLVCEKHEDCKDHPHLGLACAATVRVGEDGDPK